MTIALTPESGVGITLSWKATSGGTYAAIVQVMDDCEFDGFDTTIIPVPTLASAVLNKAPGRTDNGTFTGSVYLIPGDAGVAELVALGASKATYFWQLMLNDGTIITPGVPSLTSSTYSFIGFVSNLKPGNFSGDDAPHMDFTIAISGVVTPAVGT
jgi:hypothetical protein